MTIRIKAPIRFFSRSTEQNVRWLTGRRIACGLATFFLINVSCQVILGAGTPLQAESVLIRIIDRIEVPARASGVLTEMNVVEGQKIEKGTLLGKIDDQEARLLANHAKLEINLASEAAKDDVAVQLANSRLAYSTSKYERLRNAENRRPGSILKSELDEAVHNTEQARLEGEQARRALKRAELTETLKVSEHKLALHKMSISQINAPVHGTVVEVLKRRGEWVEPGDTIVKLIQFDRLRAEGFVKAAEVRFPLTDAKVTVMIPGGTGNETRLTGKIVFVNPEVNPVNGLMRIWAEVDNQRGQLKPGLRGSMLIHPQPARESVRSTLGSDNARRAKGKSNP